MTYREKYNFNVRHVGVKVAIIFAAFIIFLFTAMFAFGPQYGLALLLTGAIIYVVLANRIVKRCTCHKCGKPILFTKNYQKKIRFSYILPDDFKYCPYCGIDFDKEIVEGNAN